MIDDTVGRVLPLLQSEADELDSRTFSQEEVQMYVKAITDVLVDREQYQQLCRNCRRKIEEGFSSQIMIRKLERIFGDLVSGKEENLNRQDMSKRISYPCKHIAQELWTLQAELNSYIYSYKNVCGADQRYELMRIASSKWGKRLISLAFRLGMNKWFR